MTFAVDLALTTNYLSIFYMNSTLKTYIWLDLLVYSCFLEQGRCVNDTEKQTVCVIEKKNIYFRWRLSFPLWKQRAINTKWVTAPFHLKSLPRLWKSNLGSTPASSAIDLRASVGWNVELNGDLRRCCLIVLHDHQMGVGLGKKHMARTTQEEYITWPTLTKGGQSRWKIDEITGENISSNGSF